MPFWKRTKGTEQERPKTSGEPLIDDLSELGLSLDSSVTDPSTALRGGILKANLRFAYANFKRGNLQRAISVASSIIVDFEKDPEYKKLLYSSPSYKKALGAAFFVLGLCHESQNLRAEAAQEYATSIQLHPGFSPSEEGLKRVKGI